MRTSKRSFPLFYATRICADKVKNRANELPEKKNDGEVTSKAAPKTTETILKNGNLRLKPT